MSLSSVDLLTVTADELGQLLSNNNAGVTSRQLVTAYLDQIDRHDSYLKAVIAKTPRDILLQTAETLDLERASGKVRSSIHGIPILIKDNIATHPSLGVDTTAGSTALVGSKPKANAHLIDKLLEAGAIIIGKANLSELANYKGFGIVCGWSAVGGQTQSAYVRGGVQADDHFEGHSNPGGSSSGSSVGVSAGYAPFAIGTETEGSLVMPAGRAGLYTLKPTLGSIPTAGVVPISKFADTVGPLAKSTKDLALLLDVLTDGHDFVSAATGKWEGLKVGTLDPSKWNFGFDLALPGNKSADDQIRREVNEAYEKIGGLASNFKNHLQLPGTNVLFVDGKHPFDYIFAHDFKLEFPAYLETLETPKVKSLAELIEFNKQHADVELPPSNPSQETLERALEWDVSHAEYEKYAQHARETARAELEKAFADNDLNVVVAPAESDLLTFAAAAGYPIATVPLGILDFNGRPHGLSAVASAHEDRLLVQFQSAFEASFPLRSPPTL